MPTLERPTAAHKAAHLDFLAEWEADGGRTMPYSARLLDMTWEDWLARTYRIEREPMEGLVPAYTYFYMDEGRLLGVINLRMRLNDYLRFVGGHIGYGVRASARRRGHATAMLGLCLREARALGLERVLICCNTENEASARTIVRNGGVLENEVIEEDGTPVQRYWISLR